MRAFLLWSFQVKAFLRHLPENPEFSETHFGGGLNSTNVFYFYYSLTLTPVVLHYCIKLIKKI